MLSQKQLKHISRLAKINKKRWSKEGHPKLGTKQSKETKEKIGLALRGENNGSWKGDGASYHSIHRYIERRKPKPLLCDFCKKVPPRVIAKKENEKYDRDQNHYFWLCDKCHFKYDNIGYKISVAKKGKPSKIKGIPKNPKSVQKMVNTKKRLFKEGKLKVWNEGLKGKEYEKHYPNGWKGGRPRD